MIGKNDLIKLASALKSTHPALAPVTFGEVADLAYASALATWKETVAAVAVVCDDSNPNFDRTRFMDASGFNAGSAYDARERGAARLLTRGTLRK